MGGHEFARCFVVFRTTSISSSGSAVSAKAVKPRKSKYATLM
jgi:hypothetical protein